MKKTCGKILVALLAAMLLAAGCRSDDDDDLSPAAEYKVLAGRLVWCAESLERATVPESASSIGNNAFRNCPALTSVVIPPSVEKIGNSTFSGVAVKEIVYGDTTRAWDTLARGSGIVSTLAKITVYCTDGIWGAGMYDWEITDGVLTQYRGDAAAVTLPHGVTSIGADAFAGCASLTSVEIPASVESIGTGAISAGTTVTYHGTKEQWESLAADAGLEGLTVFIIDENDTLTGYCGDAADITIPDRVKGIAGGVFAGHAELERVTIPAGVTAVGTGAFSGSGITEITFGGTVADWDAVVEAGGIADELADITVTCADGTWTPGHTHDWSETYTGGGDGTHHQTCVGCGATKTEPHAYGDETCTDDGHSKTCALCTYSATKPHSWSSYTDDGTDTHSRTCAVEGFEAHSESAAHDYEYKDNGDDTHTITCTTCEYSKTEEHRYEDSACLDCKCPRPTTVYVASTGSDDNSGSRAKPFATIQKAIDTVIAINDGSAYTICIDGTLTQSEEASMATFFALKKELNLTIKALSGTATLDGGARLDADGNVTAEGSKNRIIYANPGTNGVLNLTLENLVITGGNTTGYGGGIYIGGSTLKMKDCTVEGNAVTSLDGGGICVISGALTMERCTISGNASKGSGGGVYVHNSGTLKTEKCVFSGNISNGIGGAIFLSTNAEATMTDDEIKGNTASGGGGAYVDGGTLTMKNCKVEGNIATSYYAGGIGVRYGGTVTMDGGTVSGNRLEGSTTNANYGGGVYVIHSGSTFTMKGDATISGNILSESTTNREGSGVYVNYSGTFEMEGGTISGGNAKLGGGVYVTGGASNFKMSGGTITGNTATASGGGVYVEGGTFTMSGGTIGGNSATTQGSGVYITATSSANSVMGTFNMIGSAKVAEDNDVYLSKSGSNVATITVAGNLTAATPVATITPSAYTAGRQVLSVDGTTVTAITQDLCDKFAVTKEADGTKWKVAPDDVKGVLKEDIVSTGGGGISVTIPGVGTYTFKVESGGTEVVDGTKLQSGASVIFSEVRKDGVALTASDGTFSIEIRDESEITFPNASATGFQCAVTVPVVPPIGMKMQVYVKVVLTSGIVIDKKIAVTGP